MKKISISIICVAIIGLVLNGCYYDEVVVFQGLPTNVSLKNDVVPIFTQHCSTTGCHDATPAHAPSLVPEKVHTSLVNGGYVNTIEPEKSIIYQEITVGGMPPSGHLGSNDLKIILGWITEGAKNN